MAEYLGDALFELRANIAPLRAGMLEAEGIVKTSTMSMQGTLAKGMGGLSQGLGRTGANLTRTVTLPILGIGAASAKMAIDFQAAMENIRTQAGASQKEVNKLSKEVLDMSKVVPFGPTALADALYHLESIGLRSQKTFEQYGLQIRKQIPLMQVLKEAAEGAAVGHADLEQTTTALGSAWLSGIRGATNLGTAMGTLNAIVGTGNMRMGDLVTALGTGILPMAKLAGLSLTDVGAALAVFSDEGYKSSSAATQMATALHYLYDPTKKADGALQGIGISSTQMAQDMHKPNGLLVALTDLHDHLDKLPGGAKGVKAEAVLGDIFPAGRGRVLTVLMNQLTNYQAKIAQVGAGQAKFAGDVRATQETAAYKIHQAWASIQSDMTTFGEDVLPPLVSGVKGVADEIDKVGTAFGKLDPATQKAIITGGLVVAAVGPAMRVASFFLGGASKLLSAMTIAGRIGAGKSPFGTSASSAASAAASGGLMEIAEMQVAQMMVGELVAKQIPGLSGAAGRGMRGGVTKTASARVAASPVVEEAAAAAPEGMYYDPVLGTYVRKPGTAVARRTPIAPSTTAVVSAEERAARMAATASFSPGGMLLSGAAQGYSSVGLRAMQASSAELAVIEREAAQAAIAQFAAQEARTLGSKGALSTQLATAMRSSGKLSPEEAFAMAYPGAKFGGPEALTSVAQEEAAAKAAAAEARVPLGSRLKSGLGTLKSGAARLAGGAAQGLMIGTTGVIASQLIGSAVKGSVGSAIKEIGTDASIGAGIGAVFGPEGIAGGAIIGGLVGTFKHFAKTHGQDVASSITGGGFGGPQGSAQQQNLAKTIATAVDQMNKLTTRTVPGRTIEGRFGATGREATKVSVDPLSLSVDQQAVYMKAAYAAGHAVAGQLEKGWNQYKFEDEPTMFVQLRGKLADLPPAAQGYGVQSAVKFAQGLEKQGRLPKGAAERMLKQVEQEFPAFAKYLDLEGTRSVQQFTKTMDFRDAEKSIRTTLNTIAYKDFPQVQTALELTRGSVADKAAAVIKSLQGIQKTGTGPMKVQATKDIAAVKKAFQTDMTDAAAVVEQKAKDMSGSLQQNSASAEQIATQNFNTLFSNISAATAAGVLNVNAGMSLLAQAANATLTAFGGEKVPIPVLKSLGLKNVAAALSTPGGRSALENYGQTTGQGPSQASIQAAQQSLVGKATGGLIQVGRRGEKGYDNVPMNVGGQPIVVGRGEQVAVFTGEQQRLVNQRLSDMGGLPGLFRKHKTPHYMAQGGIVGQVNDFFTKAGFDKIAIAGILGNAMQESSLNPNTPGGGMWQQITNFGQGTGGTLLNQMQMMLSQIGGLRAALNAAGSPGAAAEIFEKGFEIAGIPAMANRIRYANEAFAGQLGAGLTGGAGGAGAPMLKAPTLTGTGVLATLGRQELKKATAQVNKYIQRHTSPLGGGLGGLGMGASGVSGPSGLGIFDGRQVAAWIIPELEYARAHGWMGHITSGYRTEAQSAALGFPHDEHTYPGPYPHGAVDFGGMNDPAGAANRAAFMAATAGYTGPRLLTPQGFHDDGHMSGTGHVQGGFVDAIIHAATGISPSKGTNKKPVKTKKPMPKKRKGVPQQKSIIEQIAKAHPSWFPGSHGSKFPPIRGLNFSAPAIEKALGYLENMLGDTGVVAKLQDQYSATDAIFQAQHPDLTYIVTQDPITGQDIEPYIDMNAVQLSRNEIQELVSWETQIQADLKLTQPVFTNIINWIKDAIAKRKKEIQKRIAQIKANLAAIKKLKADMAKVDPNITTLKNAIISAGTGSVSVTNLKKQIDAAEGIYVPAGKAGDARRASKAALLASLRSKLVSAEHGDKVNVADLRTQLNNLEASDKTRKAGDQTQITALEAQNYTLGGDQTTVGKSGQIGQLQSQIDSLTSSNTDTISSQLSVQGASGLGGSINDATVDLIELNNQWDSLSDQSLGIQLGQAQAAFSPSTDDGALADLLEQQNEQLRQQLYVENAQFGVLSQMAPYFPSGPGFNAYQLPPYAGSFAEGGIVPGPIGAPRTAIVHGQEKITPPSAGSGNVHLHFANGMEWLKNYVTASVEDTTRGMARRAARQMPSRGGGMLVMR